MVKMKRALLFLIAVASTVCLLSANAYAGEVDVLINKLVEKGVLSPSEAQIVMDDTKLRVSKDLAEQKSYAVPDWTQRIKWGGDVRFRTQGDWGDKRKTNSNADIIKNQEWANKMRGRFWMEGKVNDFTYAGVRFAGGAAKANSTNDTMTKFWDKASVMFDQYFIRFEAPREAVRDYGKYFNDIKVWAGRFPIPFNYSEMVWDSDINPQGVAMQYVSPDIKTGVLPSFNLYSNGGMFWLNEDANTNTDPMLWVLQGGAKTDEFGPLASTVDLSTAIYNFANMQNKFYTGGQYAGSTAASDGTNTRWTRGDTKNADLWGKWRYEYNVLDILISIDNRKVFDYEFPHGFYADYINNVSCSNNSLSNGVLIGGYIGKKKIKEPGDWKARAEWRYIERDAIPDFMPDSDFYGFGTYSGAGLAAPLNMGNNGLPLGGGTNGKGINLALEYQLFKNTALNLEYYCMEPIRVWNTRKLYNELQMDVITKF
jgi:hypothetical protein